MGENQPLDPRRGDRLGSQELARQILEVAQVWGLGAQLPAGSIGIGGRGRDIGPEAEALRCDRRWNVGLKGEAAASRAPTQSVHPRLPALIDQRAATGRRDKSTPHPPLPKVTFISLDSSAAVQTCFGPPMNQACAFRQGTVMELAGAVICASCVFDTDRLLVREWHSARRKSDRLRISHSSSRT